MRRLMRAVSLIEVLIALAIISIGVVSLVKFQGYMANSRIITSQQAEAITLAREYINTARRSISIEPMSENYGLPSSGSFVTLKENTNYRITHTVTRNNDPDYFTIDVNVAWLDPQNTTHSIDLSTRVAYTQPSKIGEAVDAL